MTTSEVIRDRIMDGFNANGAYGAARMALQVLLEDARDIVDNQNDLSYRFEVARYMAAIAALELRYPRGGH